MDLKPVVPAIVEFDPNYVESNLFYVYYFGSGVLSNFYSFSSYFKSSKLATSSEEASDNSIPGIWILSCFCFLESLDYLICSSYSFFSSSRSFCI